jgi:pimeloyl-ACP methyl ester carboxylesterase
VAPVLDATANDVIKRVAATAGVQRAFSPGDVDPEYKQRLLSVSMSAGNLAAFASDQLEFDDTSRWLDDNVPAIRVPSVIIGAEDDKLVGIGHIHRLDETLPGSRLVIVDGSHMIAYTHPDVIAAQVKDASRR